MTKFGKGIFIFIIFIVIVMLLTLGIAIYKMIPKADFSMTAHDENGMAYMLMLENRPSGKYYLECTSGYGLVTVGDKAYNLKNEKQKTTYSTSFLNHYYVKGTIMIDAEDIIGISTSNTDEPFTVEFTYVGD